MNSRNKTVLVFGTFDILHPGHRWFLKKAAGYGSLLIAAVARDSFVEEWKGKPPVSNEGSRIEALLESGLVQQAVLSDTDIRTYGVVDRINPSVICLGHDQNALKEDLEHWLHKEGKSKTEIVVLPPWKRRQYSSTRRNRILAGAGACDNYAASWGFYALMVLAMAFFGFSWVSGKRISGAASPAVLSLIRFFITMLCFIPLAIIQPPGRLEKGKRLRGWMWTILSAVFLTSYNVLFFSGLGSGLAGQGGLIVTTLNPLFTYLIVSFSSQSKPRGFEIAGLTAGIGGGILLLSPWKYTGTELLDSGNIAFLTAALSWSLLTLSGRRAQKELGFRRFNLGLYALACLMLLPIALAETDGTILRELSRGFWFDMAFISVAVGAFGTGAYFMASSRLGAARGSAFTYLVPVSALSFTAVFLGEIPDLLMIAGGFLAILAVTLVNRRRLSTSPSA